MRREEGIPSSTERDVKGFRAAREGGIVVEESEEIDKDHRESL